jgi:hypothetical protein
MKTNIITAFAVLFASVGAFASTTTYQCDLPKDAQGNALLGGPSYEVAVGANGVVLKERVGADEGHAVKTEVVGTMNKTAQEVEFAVYSLDGVSATVGRVFDVIWREGVSIDLTVGSENYSADCK